MRINVVCAILVLLSVGCDVEDNQIGATPEPTASDFAGDYYYVTGDKSCGSFAIDSTGLVDISLFDGGPCGSGSKVECVDSSCSLTCLQYNNGDTTAIFSITDQRPLAEVMEKYSDGVRKGSTPDALALSPYVPRGLSVDEVFDGMEERLATGVYINLYFHLVDCEQAIKSKAAPDEVPSTGMPLF